MKKHWNFLSTDKHIVEQLQASLCIDFTLCKLLVQRGITDFDAAKNFFRYSFAHSHNPLLMQDMQKAVERIAQAIENGEKILIFGDYDVDGTTGVALLYRFLSHLESPIDYYLPDRHLEGYGLSEKGVLYAKENDATLLITVDCGIKAIERAQLAKKLGIDLIICDHHLPFEQLPEAVAVLDPLRSDCTYPFKGLSGAGVAFKLCQALTQHFGMDNQACDSVLDLLCLSICCDIVPIIDENRIFCEAGLKKINQTPSTGIKALLKQAKRPIPLTVSDLVYGLGPMINAAGRLGHAKQAVQLLLNEDTNSAMSQAQYLAHQNRQRRILDMEAMTEAKHMLQENPNWESEKTTVLYNPGWHKGILGILAARVAEQFYRPSIIFTDAAEGELTGSARSVLGFNFYESLEQCADLFEAFGGHQHAAGIRMKKENLTLFQAKLEQIVAREMKNKQVEEILDIHADLDLEALSPSFLKIYRQFAPFGPKNRRPVFVARQVRFQGEPRFLKDEHVQFNIQQLNGKTAFPVIGFRMAPLVKNLHGRVFDLAFSLKEEMYKGKMQIKLHAKDMRISI